VFAFKDAFPSPLSKTKLLLPSVSFAFPEPFLPFIPPHVCFPHTIITMGWPIVAVGCSVISMGGLSSPGVISVCGGLSSLWADLSSFCFPPKWHCHQAMQPGLLRLYNVSHRSVISVLFLIFILICWELKPGPHAG
jgi:hypothetical protein